MKRRRTAKFFWRKEDGEEGGGGAEFFFVSAGGVGRGQEAMEEQGSGGSMHKDGTYYVLQMNRYVFNVTY